MGDNRERTRKLHDLSIVLTSTHLSRHGRLPSMPMPRFWQAATTKLSFIVAIFNPNQFKSDCIQKSSQIGTATSTVGLHKQTLHNIKCKFVNLEWQLFHRVRDWTQWLVASTARIKQMFWVFTCWRWMNVSSIHWHLWSRWLACVWM